jgi:hypothetical protein
MKGPNNKIILAYHIFVLHLWDNWNWESILDEFSKFGNMKKRSYQ